MEKPWIPLNQAAVRSLPGQLGVYQLSEPNGTIFYIGYAGGRTLFGLRSELERWLKERAGKPAQFRYEINMQYLSRHRELLMLHVADHGRLPLANTDVNSQTLGRLHPGVRENR
jgi:hypothetical protein